MGSRILSLMNWAEIRDALRECDGNVSNSSELGEVGGKRMAGMVVFELEYGMVSERNV
jgi:hypothetical protein